MNLKNELKFREVKSEKEMTIRDIVGAYVWLGLMLLGLAMIAEKVFG
jgi:hypothetical protein